MKKIIIILILITLSIGVYSQAPANLRAKTLSFPITGTTVVSKLSPSLTGIDTSNHVNIPTGKAVNDRIRQISVTDIKRSNDSIYIRINNAWVFKYKDSVAASGSAAAVNARVDSLIGSLSYDVIHNVTSTNTTPVNGDTLILAPNTQATFYLTFHGYDNTGVINDALWYERKVFAKYSDGAISSSVFVHVEGTDIAEGTLNAVPPPVTFVISGTLIIIKVASPSTMNIPWSITRTDRKASPITAH